MADENAPKADSSENIAKKIDEMISKDQDAHAQLTKKLTQIASTMDEMVSKGMGAGGPSDMKQLEERQKKLEEKMIKLEKRVNMMIMAIMQKTRRQRAPQPAAPPAQAWPSARTA